MSAQEAFYSGSFIQNGVHYAAVFHMIQRRGDDYEGSFYVAQGSPGNLPVLAVFKDLNLSNQEFTVTDGFNYVGSPDKYQFTFIGDTLTASSSRYRLVLRQIARPYQDQP